MESTIQIVVLLVLVSTVAVCVVLALKNHLALKGRDRPPAPLPPVQPPPIRTIRAQRRLPGGSGIQTRGVRPSPISIVTLTTSTTAAAVPQEFASLDDLPPELANRECGWCGLTLAECLVAGKGPVRVCSQRGCLGVSCRACLDERARCSGRCGARSRRRA